MSNDTFFDLMEVVQEERCYQCKLDDVEACPYRHVELVSASI